MDRKIIGQATLMIMSSMFLSVDTTRFLKYVWPFFGHMYRLLLLQKMKIKQTENNVMLFIFYKNIVPKKNSGKLEISIAKREAAGITYLRLGWCFLEKYTARPFTKWNFWMPKPSAVKSGLEALVRIKTICFAKSFIPALFIVPYTAQASLHRNLNFGTSLVAYSLIKN